MNERTSKIIHIPEVTRVEGHAAVVVDIENGKAVDVQLQVFEGTRFFEKIVVGHKFDEIAHITSRVCAICSTGHVLAALFSIERLFGISASAYEIKMRELMHLGMFIESHSTHICALALPDFLQIPNLARFATEHQAEFLIWTRLRALGASIQSCLGGRPFHPVTLSIGRMTRYSTKQELLTLQEELKNRLGDAIRLFELVKDLTWDCLPQPAPLFAALEPEHGYGYFGATVVSSGGAKESVMDFKEFLSQNTVTYSHAKRVTFGGDVIMVGALARLFLFGNRLTGEARLAYDLTPLSQGKFNCIWNSLAQSIEIVYAIEQAIDIINELLEVNSDLVPTDANCNSKAIVPIAGTTTGAVECPRGTLYHSYRFDDSGNVSEAEMITPSAQNTARIECEIRNAVDAYSDDPNLESKLETIVRAFDPCNTCATHMVSINWRKN